MMPAVARGSIRLEAVVAQDHYRRIIADLAQKLAHSPIDPAVGIRHPGPRLPALPSGAAGSLGRVHVPEAVRHAVGEGEYVNQEAPVADHRAESARRIDVLLLDLDQVLEECALEIGIDGALPARAFHDVHPALRDLVPHPGIAGEGKLGRVGILEGRSQVGSTVPDRAPGSGRRCRTRRSRASRTRRPGERELPPANLEALGALVLAGIDPDGHPLGDAGEQMVAEQAIDQIVPNRESGIRQRLTDGHLRAEPSLSIPSGDGGRNHPIAIAGRDHHPQILAAFDTRRVSNHAGDREAGDHRTAPPSRWAATTAPALRVESG
jgi:hypothetical protein